MTVWDGAAEAAGRICERAEVESSDRRERRSGTARESLSVGMTYSGAPPSPIMAKVGSETLPPVANLLTEVVATVFRREEEEDEEDEREETEDFKEDVSRVALTGREREMEESRDRAEETAEETAVRTPVASTCTLGFIPSACSRKEESASPAAEVSRSTFSAGRESPSMTPERDGNLNWSVQ